MSTNKTWFKKVKRPIVRSIGFAGYCATTYECAIVAIDLPTLRRKYFQAHGGELDESMVQRVYIVSEKDPKKKKATK